MAVLSRNGNDVAQQSRCLLYALTSRTRCGGGESHHGIGHGEEHHTVRGLKNVADGHRHSDTCSSGAGARFQFHSDRDFPDPIFQYLLLFGLLRICLADAPLLVLVRPHNTITFLPTDAYATLTLRFARAKIA